MLPPMRPRPIIPSCTRRPPVGCARRGGRAPAATRSRPPPARGSASPNPNGWPGSRAPSPVSSTTCRKSPVGGPPLCSWPGRVQVARPEAVRDDAAGRLRARGRRARAPSPRSRRSGRRTPGCRRSRPAAPARTARPAEPSRLETSGSSPDASTSFVLSFAACTSGWSNGLMPRIEPATAVANSQRKNSCPSSYGSASRTSCAWRSGPSAGSPGAGTSPFPCLPVDSASSCSAQRPKPPALGSMQTLSRPSRQPSPSARPSSRPGLPSARRHASAISHARGRAAARRRRPSARPAPSRTATAPSSGRRSSARRRRSRAKLALARELLELPSRDR